MFTAVFMRVMSSGFSNSVTLIIKRVERQYVYMLECKVVHYCWMNGRVVVGASELGAVVPSSADMQFGWAR